ncbi:unnamed protein product [Mesocestoides corti]|uniref:Uncharacterized protein n=1 Tax=Mesocestoides corti TaxID=53468 RepID=A0A3P6GEX6_MESCO|nr:unnamed protein product [Mesocestoides corti]
MKCDVIVDDIHSIKVDTTTQELYLHNTPESLVVIGYDEFGNTFSSLDGIPFEWKIHQASDQSSTINSNGVLRFLTWTESEYTTPSRIGLLEAEGMQGYMQLVSGLRTGSAVVSVVLREPAYSHVKPAKVRLLVMANAQLNPPVLYVMPNSIARFRVNVVRQDADEEISMPSPQYYLSVSDDSIVELEPETGAVITARKCGQTTVTLLDRNVEEAIHLLGSNPSDSNDTETQLLSYHRRPTSIVFVVEPAYFRFTVQPVGDGAQICVSAARHSSFSLTFGQGLYNHWTLETGKTYLLALELYDQNNHRLFPSDNIRISIMYPGDMFKAVNRTENGTVYTIVPLKTGTVTLKASLDGTGETKLLNHLISGSQEVVVYSPLTVLPKQLTIAWDFSENNSEGYALAAVGGSGDYVWTVLPTSSLPFAEIQSSGLEVVSVTSNGALFPKGLGSAVVVASDLRNPDMCSHSSIRVNSLSTVNFSPGRAEVYLPKHPLLADEARISSLLSTRSISEDVKDLIPDSLVDRIPQDPQEKMAKSILSVGLTAMDTEGNTITNCHNLPIKVRPLDSSIVSVLPGVYYLPPTTKGLNGSNVCAFVRLFGLREGFTELGVFYSSGERSKENKVPARFPVAVYKDITFLAEGSVIAVAVGSSRRISHIHGPNPWRLDPGLHFVELDVVTQSGGKTKPTVRQQPKPLVSQNNNSITGYSFILRCESSGSFQLNVIIGNHPSSTNPVPAVLSASITLICDIPSKIHLVPHLVLPALPENFPPCPFTNRSFEDSEDFIPFSNNAPLKIEIVFAGLSGYELTGVDSINARTHLLSETEKIDEIVSVLEPQILTFRPFSDVDVARPANPYLIITPRTLGESAGRLRVQVVASHRWPGEQSVELEATLPLKMSPKVEIKPLGDFQLLLHHEAVVDIHLSHGSGFFHFNIFSLDSMSALSNQTCLSIYPHLDHKSGGSRTLRDFSLRPKCKGKVIIRVTDLCFPAGLAFPGDTKLKPGEIGLAIDERLVSIVGLGSLRLFAPSQLELLSKAPVYVRAFDTDGKVLSARFASLLDLRLISSSDGQSPESYSQIVSPCPDAPPDSDNLGLPHSIVSSTDFWLPPPTDCPHELPGIARFNLCGQSLGPSKLKALSGNVTSNVEVVNVFAPLSLKPCNLNLLLGAAHKMTTSGGPSSRSIAFQVTPERGGRPNLRTIQVHEEGEESGVVLRAELGQTGSATVSAKATSSTGYTDLDTSDFDAWGLTSPPASLSSEASCLVNVVALAGVRIGCSLPTSDRTSGSRTLVASTNSNSTMGGVPVWAEGVAAIENDLVVTPMGLADVQPPLHFSWGLSPPMPNSPAHLVHWLSQLNVDPDDINLSSGMVLVGVAPGQVKLQLTVFTEGGASTGQLVSFSSDGRDGLHPVNKLSAEVVFTIVPHLRLLNPPRQNPRLLISPNSQIQLKLPSHILADGGTDYTINCPSDSPPSLLQLSPGGFLESGAHGRCDAWSNWRLKDCRCHLRIDYSSMSTSSVGRKERTLQSLAFDVVVKPPLYLLARAQPGHHSLLKPSTGLPFGGPYPIILSFHDELGEAFDAVAEEFLSFRIRAHRSNLLDYSVVSDGSGSHHPLGRLMLRLTPPLHADLTTLQSATTIQLTYSNSLMADETTILAPSYLTIPTGPPLDVCGNSELTVGQWACLPILPQGDGIWSSSDPSLLWIDNQSLFMLPLRAGHVHIQFTPKGKGEVRTSLLGKVLVKNVCSSPNMRLESKNSDSSFMSVGLDSSHEVFLRFGHSLTKPSSNGSCADSLSITRISDLSPLMCSAHLELGGIGEHHQARSAYLPNWLRAFLFAERYAIDSGVIVESNIVTAIADPIAYSSDFRAQLVPSPLETGMWTCIIRSGSPGDYPRLATLPPGSRLVVEVQGVCGTAVDESTKEVIAKLDLKLVPGFKVLVPPLHLSPTDGLVLTPRVPKGNLLVFIPPATLAQMESAANIDQPLKARSQRPDLLAISSAPRPVHSVSHVKAALDRISGEHNQDVGGQGLGGLLKNLSLMMENEAEISPEQAFGNGLVWMVGIKSLPTKTGVV